MVFLDTVPEVHVHRSDLTKAPCELAIRAPTAAKTRPRRDCNDAHEAQIIGLMIPPHTAQLRPTAIPSLRESAELATSVPECQLPSETVVNLMYLPKRW